jgi:hypothetical protein
MDDFQFQTLQKGLDGIHARLDRMNGRVSESEQEIAVLKDRSDRAEKQGGMFGAIGGGLVTGVILTVKALMGK